MCSDDRIIETTGELGLINLTTAENIKFFPKLFGPKMLAPVMKKVQVEQSIADKWKKKLQAESVTAIERERDSYPFRETVYFGVCTNFVRLFRYFLVSFF